MAVTRAFFGYVEEIGRLASPDGGRPGWIVRVRDGSSLIGVDPAPTTPIEIVQSVYARAEKGIASLATGDLEGADLPYAALKHLRSLSETARPDKQADASMRLWVKCRPITLSPEIAETIREDWRSDYKDYGTVEGRLEAIQDHGGLELRVRDPALRLAVACHVPEEMLEVAFRNFRKRVEVSGLVHFRRNGFPVSIDVSGIDPLPDDGELPSIEEVRGVMRLPV
ncbi:MAG: hypothetical protein ACREFZ_05790 [Acetobacteraceae bacterium]